MLIRKSKKTTAVPAVELRQAFRKERLSSLPFQQLTASAAAVTLPPDAIADNNIFMKSFISACARIIPVVSASIWVWHRLSHTNTSYTFNSTNPDAVGKATEILTALHTRISPIPPVKGNPVALIFDLFFRSVFKYGRFAALVRLAPNHDHIATLAIPDPYRVRFSRSYTPYLQNDSALWTSPNPHLFFYYGLNMEESNPYGEAMFEAAWSLIKIADDMLQDMKLSASNAGIPRLHIKVKQPPKFDFENDEDYRTRISSYFQETVRMFQEIGPDDNVFTWEDVSVSNVGGQQGPSGFVWRANRSIIDEEVISAFHLYPWLIGKSAATTKNWVRSQYDVLMMQVESMQNTAARFLEWVDNFELQLAGLSDIRVTYQFSHVRDPNLLDSITAEQIRVATVLSKARAGIIDADTAARELGYEKSFDPKLITTMTAAANAAPDLSHTAEALNASVDRLDSLLEDIHHANDSC